MDSHAQDREESNRAACRFNPIDTLHCQADKTPARCPTDIHNYPDHKTAIEKDQYDVIIIGAGPAGQSILIDSLPSAPKANE
jgi:hypothetical protein